MRWLLCCLVAVFPAWSALAADPPPRANAVYFAPAPAFAWSGLYGGLEVGADFFSANANGFGSNRTAGALGGLVGYNFQVNRVVLGFEGAGGARLGSAVTVAAPSPIGNLTVGSSAYGDLRGRLGYAVADRALVYTTGGAAFGDAALNTLNTLLGGLPVSVSTTRTGWTAGAGLDYALADHWIGRVEYRYRDLGRAAAPVPVSLTSKALMVGLIYKFGGP
jgi:outer membrane immunogenic protein